MNVKITDIDGKKPSFVQWDVDRVLYIEGTDSQPCLHFANPMLTRAIVVEAEADGSRWSCQVPNIILQTAAPIVISVFIQPDEGKTVLTDWVKVQPKLKPQDYTYEENIGYTNWVQKTQEAEELLATLEETCDQAQDLVEDIQGKLERGEFDGEDGISPDVSVTAITGGHRVTIVDSSGTNQFDVLDGTDGDDGDPGVYVGSTEPTDPTVRVWIDTSGDADETDVFWATYNTTTEAEITAAVTAGKAVLCKISDEVFYLVSKAAIGPSGSAWLFASANQTSIRVTFVSGSYWNSISTRTIPSKTSDLTNDSGFITGYTETDPTVPSWAKASSKPSYTASEVGAAPAVVEVTVSTAGAVTQALDAGKIYHFTGALTALTITLNAAPSGQLAQYHFDFNCGSTAPTVTIPNTVTMPDGNSFDASKHYEVDILNNYGVVMAWATS